MTELRLSSSLILIAIALAACDKSHTSASADAGQIAAKVNGKEIALREIAHNIGKDSLAPQSSTAQETLDRLIDQELLAQKALEMHLDRDPQVRVDIEEAKHQILAKRYIEQAMQNLVSISPDEINDFYRENPALFEQRQIYRFDELTVSLDNGTLEAFKIMVGESDSLDQVATWLQLRNQAFRLSSLIKSAEQIAPDALAGIASLKKRQIALFEAAGTVTVIQLLQSMNAPLRLEDVRLHILHELARQKRLAFTQVITRKLRDSAHIEYLGAFADSVHRRQPAPVQVPLPRKPSTGNDSAPRPRSPPGLL